MKRGFGILLAVLLLTSPTFAAPKSDLWDVWVAHDPASAIVVDHSLWDGFLKQHVLMGDDGVARVRYGQIGEERKLLARYLTQMSEVVVSRLNRDEQFAFWVNLYNALTVKTVLDHYPVASIMNIDISPGLFAYGPWGKKLTMVEGRPISLDDIEHRILRPIFKDPRLHYVLNCAALGCPNLGTSALSSTGLERTLDDAATRFINHPRGFRKGPQGYILSKIYRWYDTDFGDLKAHLSKYRDNMPDDFTRAADYDYDWALNDAL